MRIWLVALVFCIASPQAWGCSNDGPKMDANTFIEQAERIVLVKVASAKFVQEGYWGLDHDWGNLIEYTFNITDPIKGEVRDNEITYKGRPVAHSREIDDFNMHSDQTFWDSNYAGRTSGELILDEDDKWLAYVREKVKEQPAND